MNQSCTIHSTQNNYLSKISISKSTHKTEEDFDPLPLDSHRAQEHEPQNHESANYFTTNQPLANHERTSAPNIALGNLNTTVESPSIVLGLN